MPPFKKLLLRLVTTRVAWPLLICVALLCTTSIFALELASPERADKQQIWLAIGAAVVFLAILPHFNLIGQLAIVFYGITCLLLIAVFLAPEVQYTHRWFVLPFGGAGGTQLQPSELAKISFVLLLAWYLKQAKNVDTLEGLVIPFLLTMIPAGLILMEPDLGTALLFPLILYAMLLAAGAKMRHLLIIALVALFAMPGAYPFLRPYQQERIRTLFINVTHKADEAHNAGPNYQANQSKLAISSGGITGQGGEGARPIRQGLLPEAYTDFIFAVVGAEWGFVGCSLVVLFYLGLLAAAIEIASSTKDIFGRLMVVGLAASILLQATMNLHMTVGIMPVVGVALPFVSYGGSSLLTSLLAVGLLLNVSVRRN